MKEEPDNNKKKPVLYKDIKGEANHALQQMNSQYKRRTFIILCLGTLLAIFAGIPLAIMSVMAFASGIVALPAFIILSTIASLFSWIFFFLRSYQMAVFICLLGIAPLFIITLLTIFPYLWFLVHGPLIGAHQ